MDPKMLQIVSADDRCLVCKRPLRINNLSGYCKRHSPKARKEKYRTDPLYRRAVLEKNEAYHKEHAEEIRAKSVARYRAQREKMGKSPGVGRKLSIEQVAAIRAALTAGTSRSEIAANFKISYSTVAQIAAGRIWKSKQDTPTVS